MEQESLASAVFDKNVKFYWLVLFVLISFATIMFIPLIPLVIIVVLFVSQRILDAMSAELMARKLVVKRGIVFKVEKSIPLEKITDVGMTQGPLMRLFGIYRLDFETAGQSGPGALVSMLGIVNPSEFRDKILKQKDDLQSPPPTHGKETDEEDYMKELLLTVKRIEGLLASRHDS